MNIDKNSPVPQYYQLETWLEEQIDQGIFREDEKIPTEEELARMTGLSRPTIRHAIQNLVNKGYLSRKRRLGTFVNKRFLKPSTQNILGILVNFYKSGYASELIRGAGDASTKENYSLVLCNTDDSYVMADMHIDRLLEQGIRGVVFVPTAASDEKNTLLVEKLLRKDVKVVIADRHIPGVDIDNVITDNFWGAYNITNYLISKGHHKIAIPITTLFNTARERLEGYKQALKDANIPVNPSLIFLNNERFTDTSYYEYATLVLNTRNKFSSIFASDDKMAHIFFSVARQMNIRIPEDISLVGYDDLPCSSPEFFDLTTVHQPIYEMGQKSTEILLSRINGSNEKTQQLTLKSYLAERRSVLPQKYYKRK